MGAASPRADITVSTTSSVMAPRSLTPSALRASTTSLADSLAMSAVISSPRGFDGGIAVKDHVRYTGIPSQRIEHGLA
jgi:hypothetical protein